MGLGHDDTTTGAAITGTSPRAAVVAAVLVAAAVAVVAAATKSLRSRRRGAAAVTEERGPGERVEVLDAPAAAAVRPVTVVGPLLLLSCCLVVVRYTGKQPMGREQPRHEQLRRALRDQRLQSSVVATAHEHDAGRSGTGTGQAWVATAAAES